MTTRPIDGVLRHLRGLAPQAGTGGTDGELLSAFVGRRDDAALAALVNRHGPMVWGVCRRLLRSHHDAEDAFQATFLVLVRKAAAVRDKEAVANWLYGVAHQTAVRVRAAAAKRRGRERQLADLPEPVAKDADPWHDLRPLLDQELSRLPDKYRVLIVLCDLEGKTRKEVARQLGCPEGTVGGRLARARALLAKRLARHKRTLSGAALAAALAESAPAALVSSTVHAVRVVAAGRAAGAVSAPVLALAEGVLKAMLYRRLKVATAVLLAVAALGGGAAGLRQAEAQQEAPRRTPPRAEAEKASGQGESDAGGITVLAVLEAVDAKKGVVSAGSVSGTTAGAALGQHALKEKPDQEKPSLTASRLLAAVAADRPKLTNVPVRPDAKIVYGDLGLKLGDLRAGMVVALRLAADPATGLAIDRIRVTDIPKGKKVMTPEEAVKKLPVEEVIVEFKVAKAGAVWTTGGMLGKALNPETNVEDENLTLFHDGGKFRVILAGKANRLEALGVAKASELVGKTVRARGKVEPLSRPVRPDEECRMMVWDTDHIEVLKE